MRGFWKIALILLSTSICMAQEMGRAPLQFKPWKDQQIVEAQNRSARIANQLTLIRAGKMKPQDLLVEWEGEVTDSKRIQKMGAKDFIIRLEREQEQAQKNVEYAKELSLEDYFLVYLSQFQDNPEAISQVADKLTKEEVALLLRALLKGSSKSLSNESKMRRPPSVLGFEARL